MTAIQLNAQITQNLALLADDESLLQRVANYVQRLVKQHKKQDDTLMTKEEFFAKIDRGLEQYRQGKCRVFSDKEEMMAWLNSL